MVHNCDELEDGSVTKSSNITSKRARRDGRLFSDILLYCEGHPK